MTSIKDKIALFCNVDRSTMLLENLDVDVSLRSTSCSSRKRNLAQGCHASVSVLDCPEPDLR